MTKHLLSGVVLCGLAVGLAQGATLRYRLSGDWQDITDGASAGWGLNPNNDGSPGTALPGAGDDARINWGGNTVTVNSPAPTFGRLQIGVDEAGIVEVNSGGVITTTGDVLAGNNNANATGTLIVKTGGVVNVGNILWAANNSSTGVITLNSGGQVNVASHLWWGVTGTATVNISGTLTQTGGILGLGTSNASTAGGGTATVNVLDGGLLNLWNIHGAGTSIFPGSSINLVGTGRIELPGDKSGAFNNHYIPDGYMFGDGIAGNVDASYDADLDRTIVTVIPEPATLGLLGFGALGLLLRRRS